jgi:biopolymer transport protein TolR
MGANFFDQKNSGKKKRIISEINITPFVDILLVLLIIFMVAAPMMTSSVNVDLPKGAAAPTNEKIQPIAVSIKSDGTLFLQDESIKLGLLSTKLLEVTGNNLSSKIQVRADKTIDYGRVMDVIKTINLSGFTQVVLVTELAQ